MNTTSIRKAFLFLIVSVSCTLLLAACTPQTGEKGSDKADESTSSESSDPVLIADWSFESDCTTCHAVQGSSLDGTDGIGSIHAQEGLACMSCHTDEEMLKSVHKDISAAPVDVKRLKKTSVDATVCQDCHAQAELANLTEGSSVLTDLAGKTANPHALPENEDHATIMCGSCHKMHSSEPIEETSMDTCLSCHHEELFECGTCHSLD